MLKGREITVLGGGVAGLAAATALARRGAGVTVLEQAPEIVEVGAGIQISPNGAKVLRALGQEEALRAVALPAEAVELRDGPRGGAVLRFDLERHGHASGYWLVHRADLIALLERAARSAGVDIVLGERVHRVAVAPDSVQLDGTTRRAAGLVIGADGLHSVLRAALGGGAKAPRFTGQVAWRAVIPEAGAPAAVAEVHMGPGRHLVSYPLRGGAARNIVAVEERRGWAAEGWHHHDDPENLRRAFARFGPRVQDWLARVETVNLWGLFRHEVAPRWHAGGQAALAGDAAHPTLPFMAQGANMALEDAWVLAAQLDATGDAEAALAAYQAARMGRARRIVAVAERNARAYHLRAPLRPLAHALLRVGARIAPDAPLRRLDWLYGHDVTRQM